MTTANRLTPQTPVIIVKVPPGSVPSCPRCTHQLGESLKGRWKGYCPKCKTRFEIVAE